ncbi:MAG: ABC transporter ATP-binding protein [Candidatus Komeilibacteria bacterium]|jgi:ATP-binding cassette, subfamily B, bacterial|nr:ABC transporter ATP-binding protein [Candidatus Komeilibacteria bacterium]
MQYLTKQTFKIFWKHLRQYKWTPWFIIISIMIGSLGSIVAPLFYKDFFDIITNTDDTLNKVPLLKNTLMKVLAVYFISWIFWRVASFLTSYFQTNAMADISNSSFAYLHRHSSSFFNNNFVGSLVKKVNRFSRSFEIVTDLIFWDFLPIFVNIFLIIIVLGKRNLFLGLGILAWTVIYMIVNYYFSLYKLKYDVRRAELNSEVTGVLADTITNHLNLKLFTGYNREKKLFKIVNTKLQKLRQFTWNLANYFEAGQILLMMVLEIGIMYYAISLWQRGIISVGEFVLIQTYLVSIIVRLWNFGRIIRKYYEAMAEAEEMTEILETPHEIKDIKSAKTLKINGGQIEFKDVHFSYHKTREIISNFNLNIKAQEKIAFIGPSGSGKSTLVNLLLRNYDIDGGGIFIDKQKIISLSQDSLWKNISLVNQDPILFHRTLKENICYGQPKATDVEIRKAAKLAYANKFIDDFPEKYETYVGERGVKLSGGERQRVAIARAILKNAPILVLDEATSSLDSESEELIQNALANLMKDKTVIVIAHRLSTIMKMDRIIVLDKGKIVEQGTHQELIAKKKGLYNRLWQKQVGGFIG